MITGAVIFLVVVFVIKTKPFTKKDISNTQIPNLIGTETIKELALKDTDGDGVTDWEESLWGTDFTKIETTPGIKDGDAINKLKLEKQGQNSSQGLSTLNEENLTETDKFAREFFTTIAVLNQSGEVDQNTVDKLSEELTNRITNTPQRKIYTEKDIVVNSTETVTSFKKYSDAITGIYAKNKMSYTVYDVLQKFIIDEENVNVEALEELNPIIQKTENIINGMLKLSTPTSLARTHLDLINSLEKLKENITDIKLYDTDVILSLSAIGQYENNASTLQTTIDNLTMKLALKLSN